MKLSDLKNYMLHIGSGKSIPAKEKKKIAKELPGLIKKINKRDVPPKITLPTGEALSSASRITALKAHCLLLARKAFGANYIKENQEYEALAIDVLFYIMRDQFNSDGVKGEFCCPPCTLSLLPLYTTKCFKWVNCDALRTNVLKSLENKESMFRSKYPEKYSEWSKSIK